MAQTVSFTKRVPPGASGAGTLQALMAKQKEAAAARDAAASATPTIQSPWQGAAMIGNTISAGIREGRADRQESDARSELAGLISQVGEQATMDQIAKIGLYDPELAAQYRAEAVEARAEAARQAEAARLHEDTQSFTGAENAATRAVTTSEGAANRAVTTRAQDIGHGEFEVSAAETKRANLAGENGAAAQREETKRANLAGENGAEAQREETQRSNIASETNQAATLAETSIHNRAGETLQRDQLDETIRENQEPATANLPVEAAARRTEAEKIGLKPGTTEYDHFVLTGDIPGPAASTIINTGDTGTLQKEGQKLAAQDYTEIVQAGRESVPFMAQLKIVSDLGKNIGTGKGAEIVQALGPYAQMVGIDIAGLEEGQAYSAIVDKLAPRMRVVGAGASSDFDARQFLSSLPKLGRTPEGNQIINDTFAALSQHQQAAAVIARQVLGGKKSPDEAEAEIMALPDPYQTFRALQGAGPEQAPGGGGDPAAAEARKKKYNLD